ncbi:MAG: hypothetical protein HS115_05480 [Spirochaetales bacterium]|nr:hypothetical protein [Spirochaetales bacterium]
MGKQKISVRILDESARGELQTAFDRLEAELGIEWLAATLTTAILELIENAVKANLKRVFFQVHGYRLDEPASYSEGIRHFKREFPSVSKEDYRKSLEDLNLMVSVEVDLDQDRLLVFVENNTLLLTAEEERIRRQLARAMTAPDLLEFSVQYGDETEGSGLGLAMIVFLIRTLGFKPELFRIYNQVDRTMARLEFPLNASYVSLREQYEREQSLKVGTLSG